jgi:hypothetical protein
MVREHPTFVTLTLNPSCKWEEGLGKVLLPFAHLGQWAGGEGHRTHVKLKN